MIPTCPTAEELLFLGDSGENRGFCPLILYSTDGTQHLVKNGLGLFLPDAHR
jgi:hypothetical protein